MSLTACTQNPNSMACSFATALVPIVQGSALQSQLDRITQYFSNIFFEGSSLLTLAGRLAIENPQIDPLRKTYFGENGGFYDVHPGEGDISRRGKGHLYYPEKQGSAERFLHFSEKFRQPGSLQFALSSEYANSDLRFHVQCAQSKELDKVVTECKGMGSVPFSHQRGEPLHNVKYNLKEVADLNTDIVTSTETAELLDPGFNFGDCKMTKITEKKVGDQAAPVGLPILNSLFLYRDTEWFNKILKTSGQEILGDGEVKAFFASCLQKLTLYEQAQGLLSSAIKTLGIGAKEEPKGLPSDNEDL